MTPEPVNTSLLFMAVAILNLPICALIWVTVFGTWNDFVTAVYFWLSPRWLDWARGEADEDSWQHVKLMLFLLFCALMVVGETANIRRSLPGLASTLSEWARVILT